MKRENLTKAIEINSKLITLESEVRIIRRIKSGNYRLKLRSLDDPDDETVIPDRYQDRINLFLERTINDFHEEINTLNAELESL